MSKETTPRQLQERGRKQPNYLKRRIGTSALAALVILGVWKGVELAREATDNIGDALKVTDVGCVYEPVYPGDNNIDPINRGVEELSKDNPEYSPPGKRRVAEADSLGGVQAGDLIEVCGTYDSVPEPFDRLYLVGDTVTADVARH